MFGKVLVCKQFSMVSREFFNQNISFNASKWLNKALDPIFQTKTCVKMALWAFSSNFPPKRYKDGWHIIWWSNPNHWHCFSKSQPWLVYGINWYSCLQLLAINIMTLFSIFFPQFVGHSNFYESFLSLQLVNQPSPILVLTFLESNLTSPCTHETLFLVVNKRFWPIP